MKKEELEIPGLPDKELARFAALANQSRKVKATMDGRILHARDAYAIKLSAISEWAEEAGKTVAEWAEKNRKKLFDSVGKKSLELTHAVIGWKLGGRTVCLRPGVSTEGAIDRLQASRRMRGYVRHMVEINRAAILADLRAGEVTCAELSEFGIAIKARERFFINPKIGGKAVAIKWTVKRSLPSKVKTLEDARATKESKSDAPDAPAETARTRDCKALEFGPAGSELDAETARPRDRKGRKNGKAKD